jgi:hypothetical protein
VVVPLQRCVALATAMHIPQLRRANERAQKTRAVSWLLSLQRVIRPGLCAGTLNRVGWNATD